MRLVYVIGEPGAGKTTLVDAALAGLTRIPQRTPLPHELLCRRSGLSSGVVVAAHLGQQRERFGGTDTLSLSIQPQVVAWMATHPWPVMVGEGDRLANPRFFDTCRLLGVDLQVVLLDTPPQVAADRRHARGSAQHPGWVAGRITKTRNLTDRYQPLRLAGPRAADELRALCWPGGQP
jgi:hypothetical protein